MKLFYKKIIQLKNIVFRKNSENQNNQPMKKWMFLSVFSVLIWACGGGDTSSNDNGTGLKQVDASGVDGKAVYMSSCVACHGADGKLGVNGSKDLTLSPLTLEERLEVITNGRAGTVMVAFKNQLSPKEIQAVTEYTMTLK